MKNKKWMKGIAITAIAAMSMGMLAGCGGGADEQQYKAAVLTKMRTAMQISRVKHTKSALCSSSSTALWMKPIRV